MPLNTRTGSTGLPGSKTLISTGPSRTPLLRIRPGFSGWIALFTILVLAPPVPSGGQARSAPVDQGGSELSSYPENEHYFDREFASSTDRAGFFGVGYSFPGREPDPVLDVQGRPDAVVINEVMYNPPDYLGEDNDYEWVELYNFSGHDVNLEGWMLNDISLHGTIPRYSFYIVARQDVSDPDGDGEFFSAWYNRSNGYKIRCTVFDAGDRDLGLRNGWGRLILYDDSGHVADRMRYTRLMGGAGDGTTLEKVVSFIPPSGDAWGEGLKPERFGTPDKQNTIIAVRSAIRLDGSVYEPGDTVTAYMQISNRSEYTVPLSAWLILKMQSGEFIEFPAREFLLAPGERIVNSASETIPAFAPDGGYTLSLVTAVEGNSLAPETTEFSIDTQGNPVHVDAVPNPY